MSPFNAHTALRLLSDKDSLFARIAQSIARAKRRPKYQFALLYLDLDRFNLINESLGHAAGKDLVKEVNRRLLKCLRIGDAITRISGGDYAIVLDDINHIGDAMRVAERMHENLHPPIQLSGQEIVISACIGITYRLPHYRLPEEMVRDAEIAMDRARKSGPGRSEVFETGMHKHVMAQWRLETELRRAIEREEFRLQYQPIISLLSGRVAGFEALVRWEHPKRGLLSPAAFLSVAEETGLILPISDWILKEVCRRLASWKNFFRKDPGIHVSVNLPSKYWEKQNLSTHILNLLQTEGVEAGHLALELTEGQILNNAASVARLIGELAAAGVKTYIDDFGTGYSSLSYLANLPAYALKIDRSFVQELDKSEKKLNIVRAIIALARNLGLQVVAEGVETAQELHSLRSLGCEQAQGYYLARPADPDLFSSLVEKMWTW